MNLTAEKDPPYKQYSYPKFDRIIKKLPEISQGKIFGVEDKIAEAPAEVRDRKTGDLANWWTYRFSLMGETYLIVYKIDHDNHRVIFGGLGVRENFYRDFKQYLKS